VRSLVALLLFSCALTAQTANQRALPFSDKAWKLEGERTAIVKDGAREVLQIETGGARWPDARFEDGAIDFDVQVTSRRSFVYVEFRGVAEGELEEMYLRPHKANLPDAIQYAPVWQGLSSWQLYHGPGATAAVGFDPGEWTHVRLIVQGRRAALFVKDMAKPALIVPHLAREPKPGYIGFRGFLPGGVPGSGPIAKFANVVTRSGPVSFDFAATLAGSPKTPVASITPVASWAVSQSFVPEKEDVSVLPPAATTGTFTKIDADPGGLLELHRHVRLPKDSRVTAGVARVAINAKSAGTYAFDLGFSDIATVFLNGRPIFRGDATYAFDMPRREGLIGFDQARLYLPLVAGNNDLSILVSDVFGGWGLMGRFLDARGLTIEAK
jgi:hypothetical protein